MSMSKTGSCDTSLAGPDGSRSSHWASISRSSRAVFINAEGLGIEISHVRRLLEQGKIKGCK